jgi:GntR family transcriptional regulator
LARILRTQIHAGEYRPQDPLPTEEALTRSFGVSRITVRAALRMLADEGLIVRRSGKGTFVALPAQHGRSLWAALTVPDVVYDGQEITRRYTRRRFVRANPGVAESLRISPGGRVLQVEGLMLLGGSPLAHVTLSVPEFFTRGISTAEILDRPVIRLISDATGIRVSTVDQWTTASLADKRVADALGIRPGDALLLIERVFYAADGAPVELAVNRFRTDRFRHHLRLQEGLPAQRGRFLADPGAAGSHGRLTEENAAKT